MHGVLVLHAFYYWINFPPVALGICYNDIGCAGTVVGSPQTADECCNGLSGLNAMSYMTSGGDCIECDGTSEHVAIKLPTLLKHCSTYLTHTKLNSAKM